MIGDNKLSVPRYVLFLSIAPLLSFAVFCISITKVQMDFFGYIFLILITCSIFLVVWVCAVFNDEDNKVELAMHIVIGIISLIFMTFMAIIEVLPNEVLEYFLSPLIAMKNKYDIWSRPAYQLAHFITFVFSFPYIASFIICKVILRIKKYRQLDEVVETI